MSKSVTSTLCALLLLGVAVCRAEAATTLVQTNHHGWSGAWLLSNGQAEVIVVPSIGRVMQFRFAGETDGPFWENRALDGKTVDPKSKDWGNFGGDKTWPSPQSEWDKITPRGWPPPVAFDSMPVEAQAGPGVLILTSPVDPHFGIRTRRLIRLAPAAARMTIETTYQKMEGDPRQIGVWIITQLKDPAAVFMPVPKNSPYPDGYNKQSGDLPSDLKRADNFLSMTRSATLSTKIGNDADSLIWVGEKQILRIDSPRQHGRDYPDQGSSAEVYTNPNPLTYVELELLGPLQTMKRGDTLSQTNTYTLHRRAAGSEPLAEARRVLDTPR